MAAPPPSFQDTMHAAATINQAAHAAGYMPQQQNYDAPPPQQSGIKSRIAIKFDSSYIRTLPGALKVAECVSVFNECYLGLLCVSAGITIWYFCIEWIFFRNSV